MYKTRFFPITAAAMLFYALLGTPLNAFGGEDGLYPAAPPPGSAFVRFLNGATPSAVNASVRGKSYGAASFGQITPYAPVKQGDAELSLGAKTATASLKEGAHYTVLFVRGKLSVLEEPANDNKLKAQIILINASSARDVTLKTADGGTNVVNAVGSEKLDGRAVNAVKIPFSVYSAANKIGDIDAHSLERGSRYAVVVYDSPNGKPAVAFN
jgi:alginate O-acetyltransferase complex protein AlgF